MRARQTTTVVLGFISAALGSSGTGRVEAQEAARAEASAPVGRVVTVTCASDAGRRTHCPADTAAGVILERTTGNAACLLGRSWGYDDAGVWVTDGCSGDFLVTAPATCASVTTPTADPATEAAPPTPDSEPADGVRSAAPQGRQPSEIEDTGFNPADMYAADHIRRVLLTFPGVFSGIGEFTIHKEFVSAKVAGEVASLTDPALDRILDLAAEAGLVVILHNDINMPFPKPDQEPYMLVQLKELFERHPDTTIIWAHIGLGRIVRPLEQQAAIVERICTDPAFAHVFMDISWDEVATYATETPETIRRVADMINRDPDRFLFGTDVVAPTSVDAMVEVYDRWAPVWGLLTPEASGKVRKGNYERLFDAARVKVRAWEAANAGGRRPAPPPSPVSGAGSDYRGGPRWAANRQRRYGWKERNT